MDGKNKKLNIMVTGASGKYGGLVIDYIKKFNPDVNIFGLVRNPEKGKDLEAKGVTVRVADYSDRTELTPAFDGIDRLLFVSVSTPDIQKYVVLSAKAAGVKYIAYTSIAGIEYNRLGLEINHSKTEEWIKESGIPHTFIRHNWYLELEAPLFKAAKKTGRFYFISSNEKVSWALRREYAEAGARIILRDNNPEIITLTREAHTYGELGNAVQEALGTPLEIRRVSFMEFQKNLTDGGEDTSISVVFQNYVSSGDNGEELSDPKEFEAILGRPLESLTDIIKDFYAHEEI
jgi:NAD(P)H dehydrogenase (quinone)